MSELPFTCEKQPAFGHRGVIVTNHPLATAAGCKILAAGGNGIDSAVGALLALCVVEPMMVGIAGGGIAHIRLNTGQHVIVDGLARAAATMSEDIYQPASRDSAPPLETYSRRQDMGPSAVAVPGSLAAWCAMHRRWGKLPFSDVIDPAIHLAEHGFIVTPYLENAIHEAAPDLIRDSAISALFLPNDCPCKAGTRLVQGDFAQSLRLIAAEGVNALHGGALGRALATRIATEGANAGWVTNDDLKSLTPRFYPPISGFYRGWEISGPPPPAASGVHILQMLNLMAKHDVASMGFHSAARLHVMAEAMRTAYEDRNRFTGDPDFVDVPTLQLVSPEYAAERQTSQSPFTHPSDSSVLREGPDTTHVTLADSEGNVVSATFTINGLFGARFMVPDTGIIPNNYMMNFDPRGGTALSIAPTKRTPTSMAPMMVLRDGQLRWALGLPGGLRIYPSAFQAIVNLIDHEMNLQSAVEAPRIWADGQRLEFEPLFAPQADELRKMGHDVHQVPQVGGGMNAIEMNGDGGMQGAACWRADGTVAALGGGLARTDVGFWPSIRQKRSC